MFVNIHVTAKRAVGQDQLCRPMLQSGRGRDLKLCVPLTLPPKPVNAKSGEVQHPLLSSQKTQGGLFKDVIDRLKPRISLQLEPL